ncbi:hypothetical protein [Flavobacterium columnare]|uniref:Uncharacterized protein n=1 Tax=Flavobacterium columnare TaxID=996 RepID=A0AA94EYD3_9FLAO|nr:hypothetical protein [Flavobacterium columnare]MCH4828617.1 hypothetical protein [Flavobacterium columnare]MCH4831870.1 hypothetical protein [Flavobacterium columnare]
MLDLQNQIEDFIEAENRDFLFKVGDKTYKPIEKLKLSISYQYLLNDNSEFSFKNIEFSKKASQFIKNKTDYQIYFEKISEICNLEYSFFKEETKKFIIISSPNKELKAQACNILKIKPNELDRIPQLFIEIKLYTNKKNNRAPRIFGFIGHLNILHILFYDPFHKIYSKTSSK